MEGVFVEYVTDVLNWASVSAVLWLGMSISLDVAFMWMPREAEMGGRVRITGSGVPPAGSEVTGPERCSG
jgi:hypothetical protein